MNFNLKFIVACVLALFIGLSSSYPLYDDAEAAASGDDHHGRVQIKVYRGPTTHEGHDHFAPWGYWVKQPADAEGHH